MPPFRLQYISDIHLEFYDKLAFPLVLKPNARYLALCGDIGHIYQPIFPSFIDYCSRHWDRVFYVAGNHDYYNKRPCKHWKYSPPQTMTQIDKSIEAIIAPYKNVHYLNNKIYEDFPEVNILGSTMWTDIPVEKMGEAQDRLNDMNYIAVKDETGFKAFSPEVMKSLHSESSQWLLEALDKTAEQGKKAIVLSHHLPSRLLITQKYQSDPYTYLFYTEMTKHLNNSSLAAWICGHSHSAMKVLYKPGVWLALNCRGYPREVVEGFSPGAYIELSSEKKNILQDEEIELM